MRVELELDGVRHVAGVQRHEDHWVVTLDGREMTASVKEAGSRWSLLLAPRDRGAMAAGAHDREADTVPAVARSYDVSVEAGSGGMRLVRVDGTALTVSVIDPRAFRRRAGGTGRASGTGPATILAPMPGRVVKVLVQPGDEVAARQAVVAIEAMKMENELRAARAGVVAEVRVTQGASVEANAVLVVLE